MKIAVYYPWIHLHGGIERSILELMSRSGHDWTIYTSHYAPQDVFPGFEELNVVSLKPVTIKRDIASVMKAAFQIGFEKIPLGGFDALVVWCDGLGNLITFRNRGLPTFCICSTPLRPVYDDVYAENALRSRKPMARLIFLLFRKLFRWVDRLAWRNYHGVISTSAEVTKRITENGLYSAGERLALFHPGIDVSRSPESVTYEPFLLAAGRIMWTKNLELAIEAFRLARMPAPWKLVIAGFLDQKSRSYFEKLQQRVAGVERIEFVLSPSDEVLNDLYRRASVVLFPPLNEDWGIVPLEAMLFRKPVLANARGGPTESILPGRTGWLVEPEPRAWAEVLAGLPAQPESIRSMGEQAGEHVRKYSWTNFGSGIDGTLEAWVEEDRAKDRAEKPEVLHGQGRP
jgi:glycosyltransferase involved in cell wall biosynthesis